MSTKLNLIEDILLRSKGQNSQSEYLQLALEATAWYLEGLRKYYVRDDE